jgi:hypothetical protein
MKMNESSDWFWQPESYGYRQLLQRLQQERIIAQGGTVVATWFIREFILTWGKKIKQNLEKWRLLGCYDVWLL